MLIPLLLLVSHGPTAAPAAVHAAGDDPPVRVWFNSNGNYAYGHRAKVYAKSAADGYLIVLRSDGAGRVRVLFPLEPQGDQWIIGGKKYELKSRGGREAFIADDTSGHGTVLAAIFQVAVSGGSIRAEWSLGLPGAIRSARAGRPRIRAPQPRSADEYVR
jgi:hypothetical protein